MNKKIDNTAKHGEADAPRKPKFLGVIEGYINTDWCPARMFHPDDARFASCPLRKSYSNWQTWSTWR